MRNNQKTTDLLALFLLLSAVSALFFCFSPLITPVPNSDSGIFINIGSEILKGKILYKEVWDNKQPLLYAINALGLLLGGKSIWGVWVLEYVLLLTITFFIHKVLRKFLPPFTSLAVIVASYLSIFQFLGGNYSEEYSILFQSGMLILLFLIYLPNKKKNARTIASLCIGVLAGLSFCLKQSYLDIILSVLIYIFFLAWKEKDKQIFFRILCVITGFLLVNIPILIYFQFHSALGDYITNAFLFYKYYAKQGLLELIHSIFEIIEYLTSTPFLSILLILWLTSLVGYIYKLRMVIFQFLQKSIAKWIAFCASLFCLCLIVFAEIKGESSGIGLLEWVAIVLLLFFLVLFTISLSLAKNASVLQKAQDASIQIVVEKYNWSVPGAPAFLLLGILDLPIVIFGIALSGNNFLHYYISLFPALILLFAGIIDSLNQISKEKSVKPLLSIALIATLIIGMFVPVLQLITKYQTPRTSDPRSETAAYLRANTTQQESILQWGWSSIIYFLADRESPTRYSIQFPAYFETPFQDDVISVIYEDIQRTPPLYIADTMDPVMPFIQGDSMDTCLKNNPADGTKMQIVLNYVCSQYHYETSFGSINIYRLNN